MAEHGKHHRQQYKVNNTLALELLQHQPKVVAMSFQNFPNHVEVEQHIQEMPCQLPELPCHQDAGPQIASLARRLGLQENSDRQVQQSYFLWH
uniref:Uncharacterized protein n=1 Tax=Rhizophora mucronata TaxID=61149 RepID=A0A2P2M0Q0_RHIMU